MNRDFITPPNHVKFLAKKLFEHCGEILDGSIAYLESGGGGPVQLHTHEHSHLFIVIEGQVKIQLGKEFKIINENESFLVKGYIPHSVWNNSKLRTIMIGISVKEI